MGRASGEGVRPLSMLFLEESVEERKEKSNGKRVGSRKREGEREREMKEANELLQPYFARHLQNTFQIGECDMLILIHTDCAEYYSTRLHH